MKTLIIRNTLLWRKLLYTKYGIHGFDNIQDPNKWTDNDTWLSIFKSSEGMVYMSVSDRFVEEFVKPNPTHFDIPVYVTEFLDKLEKYV